MADGSTVRSSIVFDFDDTLVVSRSDRARILLRALRLFGVKADPAALERLWGRPFEELVAGTAPAVCERFQEFLSHYATVLAASPPTACPGVVETVPLLRETHRLFVHTASYSLMARIDLQTLGLLHHFEYVCGSDWQPSPKPNPDSLAALESLLNTLGAPLTGGWYVGDAPTDRVIAAAAGMQFAAVGHDEGVRSAFLQDGIDPAHVLRSLADLPPLLAAST